tara:strand:+ start:2122 stop:2433 length:312 start_codon:yes stop_codon:yes gene_type:complete
MTSEEAEPELTPIELSRVLTGRRYYSVPRADYDQVSDDLNTKYGLPADEDTIAPTLRMIAEKSNATVSGDELSYLFSLSQPHDISDISSVTEHTKEDWEALGA